MLDAARADAVADSLALDLGELQLCSMCLFGVSTALERGTERDVRSALRFFAPLLWDEGLEEPLRTALSRAVDAGAPDSRAAAADVERYGPASRVVKAVVRRLALQQLAEMRALERLRAPPPGWSASHN